MATLTPITTVDSWFPEERVTNNKMYNEITTKVNILIDNHILINNQLNNLIQGELAGIDQGILMFGLASAPTGWTRDITFSTDKILRVTDGRTVPPGDTPVVDGGTEGGSWTLLGMSMTLEGTHSHTMVSHTHSMSHTHTAGDHTHAISTHTHYLPKHSHTITGQPAGTYTITVPPAAAYYIRPGGTVTASLSGITHSRGAHNHGGGSTQTIGATYTAGLYGGVSGSSNPKFGTISPSTSTSLPSVTSTDSYTSHNHAISHDALWRPKYVNIMACKRD